MQKSLDMEAVSEVQEKPGVVARLGDGLKAVPLNFKDKVVKVAKNTKKLGQDDPRRIIHSLKVGLALSFVSLFYYFRPLYDGFGVTAMWAVLTVVVVFEFTVGATLCKCLNRGFATFLAGGLGLGAQHLASLCGEKGEPIFLGVFVFLMAAASTFSRFFPTIKARYDYGVLIFILTFSLVTVSGYRVEKIIELAQQRLSTVLIGGGACMIVSVFVCPVWAGEDLHKLVALNLEKLAFFLEGFGDEYFKITEGGDSAGVCEDDKSFLEAYKSVLNSKATEESLANFARWEPCHGRFLFRHPWNLYLKIGTLTRQCAYRLEALSGYTNSQCQVPLNFRRDIQESCMQMSSECGKALKELSVAVKTMVNPYPVNHHIENSKSAVDVFKSKLKATSLQETDILNIIPDATVASILMEIVTCVEQIAESVNEVSQKAHFKGVELKTSQGKPPLLRRATIIPVSEGDSDCVVINVSDTLVVLPPQDRNPQAQL